MNLSVLRAEGLPLKIEKKGNLFYYYFPPPSVTERPNEKKKWIEFLTAELAEVDKKRKGIAVSWHC